MLRNNSKKNLNLSPSNILFKFYEYFTHEVGGVERWMRKVFWNILNDIKQMYK